MSRPRASTEAGRRRASARGSAASGRSRSSEPAAAARASAEVPAPKRAARKSSRSRSRTTTRPRAKRTDAKRAPAKRTRRPSAGRRRLRRPHPIRALARLGRGSWRYRLGVIAIVAATGAAAYMFWLRDSSLVAVDNVDVVGVTSGDREQIVGELTEVAERMTTLHVDTARLERAAHGFPTVAAISVDPNFPHGMRIEVSERPPALVVSADGQQTAAAADGTLLAGVEVNEDDHLPVLELGKAPTAARLDGDPLDQALVLGAAPEPLRPLIEKVGENDFGIEVTLRGGIPVRFGSSAAAAEKWAAAAAVLADPKLDGLTYVDVRVPERAAAGGASPAPGSSQPPA